MPSDEDTGTLKHHMLAIIQQLQRPIPDLPTLLDLLSAPLEYLNILPSKFKPRCGFRVHEDGLSILKYIPSIQRALLEHVLPTWDNVLENNGSFCLLKYFFVPNDIIASVSGRVAIAAYASLMTSRLTDQSIRLLRDLVAEYPLDKLHHAIFLLPDMEDASKVLLWEDFVKTALIVPVKVANATKGNGGGILELEYGAYFSNICLKTEALIYSSSKMPSSESFTSLSYLLSRLVSTGLFPAYPPVSRSQPSFFQSTIQTLVSRFISDKDSDSYKIYWSRLLRNISSEHAVKCILHSLYSSINAVNPPLNADTPSRSYIKKAACLLQGVIGRLSPGDRELWEYSTNLMIRHEWDESRARIFICWISGGCETGVLDTSALTTFLDLIIVVWSSAEHVKHSLLSYQHYVTSLLIITISYIRSCEPDIQAVAHSPRFIQGVSYYISHLDPSIRRCGMLSAEIVAEYSGKSLDFKDWNGDGPDRLWARDIRRLLEARDVDADMPEETRKFSEVEGSGSHETFKEDNYDSNGDAISFEYQDHDSDDSVTGYASPTSSRSTSPIPVNLDEMEKEPTLNIGKKRVIHPVYLIQLGQLLRGVGKNEKDRPHEADDQEMALSCAEALIRKKQNYGTELEENAINLAYAFLSLQDNFELPQFEEKRQAALTALVACAPKQAAPALIEEFFRNQYSTAQRFALLNALSIAARELASLPAPSKIEEADSTSATQKQSSSIQVITKLADDISTGTLDKHKANTKRHALAREKRLRIRNSPIISDVTREVTHQLVSSAGFIKKVSYNEVAAQYFIRPLIHRFWGFLRDEQTREELTLHLDERQRYRGAGTGLILNPIVLAQYLRTVTILVHASQNAPEWLAVIAPDTLELAVSSGTRPLSCTWNDTGDEEQYHLEQPRKEASVLASALQLALVILDGCLELDGGQSLGLEHTALLLGIGDWAGKTFAMFDKGLKAEGIGGLHETKLKSVAAGVLLKVDEITSRWRRSMIEFE